MKWPTEVTCHGKSIMSFTDGAMVWRPAEPEGRTTQDWDQEHNRWVDASHGLPGPYGYPFRSCGYDGSMHPEDLYNFMLKGATAHGADWKYGWPHKFYIDNIPNPLAGKDVCMGTTSGVDVDGHAYSNPLLGKGPEHTHAKFYNEHIDEITDSEAFTLFTDLLWKQTGIMFYRDGEGKLMYRAPRYDYQTA
jgi:hypothetical protein